MLQPGKRNELYWGEEDSYGVPPTLAATHAMRHIAHSFPFKPKNRETTPEKKSSPGEYVRFDRREDADGWSIEAFLRPSGTLNTVPECSPGLKAAFGSIVNTTLATTVSAGTGAVGGATLASAAGLTVKQMISIVCPDGVKRARKLTAVNTGTGVVAWTPELPAAPADGAAVKAGINYVLTCANAISLFAAAYNKQADCTAGMSEMVKGMLVDSLGLMFDFNTEPKCTFGGPAKTKTDAPAQPGGFTQVGTNPPSGSTTGEIYAGNTRIKLQSLGIQLANGMFVRRDEFGTSSASEGYRMGDVKITAALKMFAESSLKAATYDAVMAGTDIALFLQSGVTEGKIIALYMPRVEFVEPKNDTPDGPVAWDFSGPVLEAVENANDQMVLALL